MESLQKQAMGVDSSCKILSYWLFPCRHKISTVTRPKSACGKYSSFRFSLLAARNVIIQDTEYLTFGFSLFILVISLSNVTFFERCEKIVTNDLGLRLVTVLPFIHQLEWVARKVSNVSVADWQHQPHEKSYRIFSRVLLRLFLGL